MPRGAERMSSGTPSCVGRQAAAGRRRPEGTAVRDLTIVAESSSGFTLLEVMVAVAILAMVLVTLLGVKNRSMEDVLLADHMTTATLLAKRTMSDLLQNAATRPQEDEEKGDFTEDEFKDYSWATKITQVPIENGDVAVTISEIRVQVLWKEGTRQEMVELLSYD